MARLGNHVTILALHHNLPEQKSRHYVQDGVRVCYVGQMHVRKVESRKLYFSPGKMLLVSLASTLSMARRLADTDAEIVHLGKPQPINSLAAKLGRKSRPVYCDCDDYEAETNKFGSAWQRKVVEYFEDDIIHYAKALTVNTRFTWSRYQKLGFPENRMVYVPNGVDRARFDLELESKELRNRLRLGQDHVIAYVGTMGLTSHPVALLLAAFQIVLTKCPDTRLLMVGGGEDIDQIQALAGELGVAEKTVFTGWIQPELVPHYLALASVTVDPVLDDLVARARSPLKIVESLVMSVPVVTGDVGDRREILEDGSLGLLVEPGSSTALAKGIVEILHNQHLRHEMMQKARAGREKWYWERLVERFIKVYEEF